ncbi:MAG: glutamate-5-semialdehyde dehydrogenase [Clostridia bacterium]|nr:glutamate-5-semialdehyde dehydrogenase [Clostridia bacterium]MBN2883384.1 glutamate-5-semialdehyde dehydrogenase [Clostridia bacterium]
MEYLIELGKKAVTAGKFLASVTTKNKDKALLAMADALESNTEKILEGNAIDLALAEEGGKTAAYLDRLRLDLSRIKGMADGLRDAAALVDPIGQTLEIINRPNGLIIEKRRVPLGVIGIIYESRPNVTSDAAGLCIKTGNAVILRGSSMALKSNIAIVDIMREALDKIGFPADCVQLVKDTDRKTAVALMQLNEYIDVLIPRGTASLINEVVKNSTVPVIETGIGICHIYVSGDADISMAVDITVNAKTSKPSVCNAAEVLLVDESIAGEFLPLVNEGLSKFNVELRGCQKTLDILSNAIKASSEDFDTEFLDYIMAVKVVSGIDEAIDHINLHGTGHSEAIVTTDFKKGIRFQNEIDAAAVYVNASTRFTDGSEFGMGAEIGISTQMLHARGPMGLKELTSYKYVITGNGQIR